MNIDMSAGSCVAACSHCKHGLAKPGSEIVSFSDDLVAMYQRLENYARAHEIELSVSFMDPLQTLPDLSFVRNAQFLQLAVAGLSSLMGGEQDALVTRVNELYEPSGLSDISIHVNPPFDLKDMENVDVLVELMGLQPKLLKNRLKGSVYFGMSQNKSLVSWQVVQQVALQQSFILNELWAKLDKVGKRTVTQEAWREGVVFEYRHRVSFGGCGFAFGGRFIDADVVGHDIAKTNADLENEERGIALAMFPWGVHAQHSTMIINDRTLRFSFAEFGELLAAAENSDATLHSLIFKAVQARRA